MITSRMSVTVNSVQYRHPESDWCVLTCEDASGCEVKVVGTFPEISMGDYIEVEGEFRTNRKGFGREFAVVNFKQLMPVNEVGLRKYLASHIINLVGDEIANRMVDSFGMDTIRVIEEQPDRLTDVPGIGRKRAAAIIEGWTAHAQDVRTKMFLHGLGMGGALVSTVHRKLGASSEELIRGNPYMLIDLAGFGFKRSDDVARKLGVSPTDLHRVRSGILHVLNESEQEGHCFLPLIGLTQKATTMLLVPEDAVKQGIQSLLARHTLVLEGEQIYQAIMQEREQRIADAIRTMQADPPFVGRALNNISNNMDNVILSDEQVGAIRSAMESAVSVITGGPGTGKTTLVKALVRELESSGSTGVVLCAPTGRAAKRLSEATNHPAATIHRTYGYHPDRGWKDSEASPFRNTTLIVDEASMIDIDLMYHVVRGMAEGCGLVLVGDVDQLPSVGPGNVLLDFIRSESVPVTRLTHIYRQAMASMIVSNAHAINSGNAPTFIPGPGQLDDMVVIPANSPEDTHRRVLEVLEHLVHKRGYNLFKDIATLTPVHRGLIGTQDLNCAIQAKFNPNGKPIPRMDRIRIGDKVMQVKNNYNLGVFNGDIGKVVGWTGVPGWMLRVDFGNGVGIVEYDSKSADSLTLAYATTIHKSQGSEYPVVVMVMHQSMSWMLVRNLAYTAVTRGKQKVVVVGQVEALARAAHNNQPVRRNTGLAGRLQRSYP